MFINYRNYRVLPEVKNREKLNAVQRERVAYRLKAKLFNKVIFVLSAL